MNILYPAAKQALLEGQFDWLTDNVVAMLIDTTVYTFSGAHATLADVPINAVVFESIALTGKSATNGVADADDVTMLAVSGARAEAMILAVDNGTRSLSPLVAYIDTAIGLPVTPANQNIQIVWDNGTNRIFAL